MEHIINKYFDGSALEQQGRETSALDDALLGGVRLNGATSSPSIVPVLHRASATENGSGVILTVLGRAARLG